MLDLILIVCAYLLGSISTAIIVCRLMELPDPRTQGSHNPGATNVLRIGGKKAAAITLIGDCLKGLLPVGVATLLGAGNTTLALVAMAAFLGHLYPLFFRFQGGKGVATAFGVFLGLSWPLGLLLALTWVVIAKLFRISSLAALLTTALTPLYAWLLALPPPQLLISLPLCLLVIWRHRENIRRLWHGKE
ncbi:MAG: acyl-phosphate glycerol 3-phosphate acyltransferase [Halothiobacillaceae bacterium]|nr:MAG: acyl-phosphate glycerol 3-phosphate acyltransferase [Halothiobacillaceae bacterium]